MCFKRGWILVYKFCTCHYITFCDWNHLCQYHESSCLPHINICPTYTIPAPGAGGGVCDSYVDTGDCDQIVQPVPALSVMSPPASYISPSVISPVQPPS